MSLQEQITTSVGYPHCHWDLDDITYKSQYGVTAILHSDITGKSHTSHNMMSLQDHIVTSLWYRIPITLWRGLKRHRCDITYMSQCNVTTRANCDICVISPLWLGFRWHHCDIIYKSQYDFTARSHSDITGISHTSHIVTATYAISLLCHILVTLWLWPRVTKNYVAAT